MREEGPVNWADIIRPTDLSGSDSCDPMDFENQRGGGSAGEADSLFVGRVIGPSDGPGGVVDAQERFKSNIDLSMKTVRAGVEEGTIHSEEKGGRAGREEGLKKGEGEEKALDKSKGKARVGSSGGQRGSNDKSTSKSVSVPPGFHKVDKPRVRVASGVASPFGKLQRGAFKYLKRPSTSSSSLKSDASIGKKAKVPLARIPNDAFNEVALNVGIKLPLNEDQIAFLKSLEEERASS